MKKVFLSLFFLLLASIAFVSFDDPIGNCPVDDGGNPVYLPDAYDCSKFYVCEFGTAVAKTCPEGLVFNPETNVCDWPSNVECSSGSGGGCFYNTMTACSSGPMFASINCNFTGLYGSPTTCTAVTCSGAIYDYSCF